MLYKSTRNIFFVAIVSLAFVPVMFAPAWSAEEEDPILEYYWDQAGK